MTTPLSDSTGPSALPSKPARPLRSPRVGLGAAPCAAPPADPALRRAGLPTDLDRWGALSTCVGEFRLRRVRLPGDLPLITAWMNDPAVAAFWHLDGPSETTERHLRAQLTSDGRSVPCLGVLERRPVGYWEIYRADLDPLALHYPARSHDIGIHVLLGPADARGRGLGSALLRAIADQVLRTRPRCTRVLAEPDVRNTACVAALRKAGFRRTAELDLTDKHAALMVRNRRLRGFRSLRTAEPPSLTVRFGGVRPAVGGAP